MKKLYSRKLAVALALASLFGVKPASGLNNLAKVGIPVALVGLIGGGGFLIHHLLKKESSNGDGDKKSPKINKKGRYYDENIRMIIGQCGMSEGCVNKLISFINDTSYGFLNVIKKLEMNSNWYVDKQKCEVKWLNHWKELDANVIAAKGVAKGNSWVEKFFDDLRGNMKIEELERNSSNECFITIGGSKFWIRFGNDSFKIERNREGAVEFQIEVNK